MPGTLSHFRRFCDSPSVGLTIYPTVARSCGFFVSATDSHYGTESLQWEESQHALDLLSHSEQLSVHGDSMLLITCQFP